MTQQISNPQGNTGANGQVIMVSRQNSFRPLSTLLDITDPLQQGYDARYNALQINLTKRYSHGFQFNVNYTWMKARSTAPAWANTARTRLRTGAPARRNYTAIPTAWKNPFRYSMFPARSGSITTGIYRWAGGNSSSEARMAR